MKWKFLVADKKLFSRVDSFCSTNFVQHFFETCKKFIDKQAVNDTIDIAFLELKYVTGLVIILR